MTNHLKQNILIIVVMLMFMALLTGCGNKDKSKELEVYGGDMIRYALCIEENGNQIVSCPIIVNKSVNDISFNNFVSDDKDLLSLTVDNIDMNECVKYKDYYVYFAIVNVECTKYDEVVDADIDKLIFDMDGEIVEYLTPYFNVKNTFYYCEKENCSIENDSLKISGGFTGIYGYIPDEEKKLDLTITSEKDITIKSYRLADFLTVENLEAGGDQLDGNKVDIDIKKGEDVQFEYTVGFGDDMSEDCLLRASQIIIYEHDNQDYLWVYTSGVYIWKGYTDYSNIKRYIDAL
ncbi:MAG: hypothetical protein ACI4EU_07255 [Butyrivibrio sp.]